MSDSEKSLPAVASTLAISIIAIPILITLTASNALAEPFLLLYKSGFNIPSSTIAQQKIKQPATVGLNDNGDLVIRKRDVSVTIAYNPPAEIVEPQERIRVAQKQDTPSISGISLRISLFF